MCLWRSHHFVAYLSSFYASILSNFLLPSISSFCTRQPKPKPIFPSFFISFLRLSPMSPPNLLSLPLPSSLQQLVDRFGISNRRWFVPIWNAQGGHPLLSTGSAKVVPPWPPRLLPGVSSLLSFCHRLLPPAIQSLACCRSGPDVWNVALVANIALAPAWWAQSILV